MIRQDRLTLDTGSFAAERRNILDRADDRLQPEVRAALMRLGLRGWERRIVSEALDIFDETARAEVDEWNQILDDMRDEFQRQLTESLVKTKTVSNRQAQIETITRWVSSMSVNAATEAATTADPDDSVGLEWVTMSDSEVRDTHEETAGQIVPTGQPFSVAGAELMYPGQPVGDPSIWINCRCVCRPTLLTELASRNVTAAGDEKRDDDRSDLTVMVALPEEGDPINNASSEDKAHVTLLFFGDSANVDAEQLEKTLGAYASLAAPDPFTEAKMGRATLGADEADVLLVDAKRLALIRDQLLQDTNIRDAYDAVDQFPAWIPHLTLGYPDNPALSEEVPEQIKFDRIALWHGDYQKEFRLGQVQVQAESSEAPPEDEFAGHPDADFIHIDSLNALDQLTASGFAVEDETDEEAPEISEADATVEVPWHGVLAPEGVPSGDGRQFAVDALTNRELPLPLKAMFIDDEGHKGSVIVGRIDRIFREDGLVKGEGIFDTSAAAYESIRLLATGMWRGVSVDVDSAEAAVAAGDEDVVEFSRARIASATLCAIPAFAEAFVALGPWGTEVEESVTEEDEEQRPETDKAASVSRETFENKPGVLKDGTPPKCKYCEDESTQYVLHSEGMAYVPACDEHIGQAVSDAEECTPDGERDASNIDRMGEYSAEFAPVPRKTKDGPGWITDPKPTKRITDYWVDGAGAAKINWGVPGDFNRCRANLAQYIQNPDWLAGLCANLHYRALRAWPGQASGRTENMSNENLTASVTVVEPEHDVLSADLFRDPEFTGPTAIKVTDDGRIFGHVAVWDVCHIAVADYCKTAPHSETDYAYFLTGEVFTDAGPVAVGQVSLGGGHADLKYGIRPAMAHYDSTSTAVADVTVGEDEFGIWCSGALRPNVTAEERHELRAAALSGDWRMVRTASGESNQEMIAALAVNVQGFPVPRTQVAAVGKQATALVAAGIPQVEDNGTLNKDQVRSVINETFAAIDRRKKAETARSVIRQRRIEKSKAAMKLGGR